MPKTRPTTEQTYTHEKMGGSPVLLLDNQSSDLPLLLTIHEAAAYLRVSKTTIRRLQQQIPFIKVGGSVRFFKHDLLAYLTKQRVASIE